MSNEKLADALRTIAEWNPPPMKDRDGNESSMALEIGSNGVRDYFRGIARNALQAHAAAAPQLQAGEPRSHQHGEGVRAMSDLDNLRPEVREALDKLRACVLRCDPSLDPRVATIRADLLRLADENNRMRGILETLDVEGHRRAERAEAELAALKARMAKHETL